jgi:hypothetical protein
LKSLRHTMRFLPPYSSRENLGLWADGGSLALTKASVSV